jgi:hypothetical protein
MRTLTRQQAIDLIRPRLAARVDDEHCICAVAARQGILCHGLAQWSFEDLKRRFWWLALRHPNLPRAEFEALANEWLVERQRRFGNELSCDVQTLERDICKGWDEFDDTTLGRLVGELCGESVNVVHGAPARRGTRHARPGSLGAGEDAATPG